MTLGQKSGGATVKISKQFFNGIVRSGVRTAGASPLAYRFTFLQFRSVSTYRVNKILSQIRHKK